MNIFFLFLSCALSNELVTLVSVTQSWAFALWLNCCDSRMQFIWISTPMQIFAKKKKNKRQKSIKEEHLSCFTTLNLTSAHLVSKCHLHARSCLDVESEEGKNSVSFLQSLKLLNTPEMEMQTHFQNRLGNEKKKNTKNVYWTKELLSNKEKKEKVKRSKGKAQ